MSTEITSDEPNTQPTPTVHPGQYGPYSDPAPGCTWAAPTDVHPTIADFNDHPDYLSASDFTRPYLLPGHASPDVAHTNNINWS